MAKKAKKCIKRKKITRSKKSQPKRKQTVRESLKFAALQKRFFSKVKQEFHDVDYAHVLDDKSKAFLNSYMEECLGARFNHSGRKLLRSKGAKQKVYNENNARQRDIYSLARAYGGFVDIPFELALEAKQEKEVAENLHAALNQEDEQEEDLLTELEFYKLVMSGATIPPDLMQFYSGLYGLPLLKRTKP